MEERRKILGKFGVDSNKLAMHRKFQVAGVQSVAREDERTREFLSPA